MGEDAEKITVDAVIKVDDYARLVDSKGNLGFELWRVAKIVAGWPLLMKSGIDEVSAAYPDKYWCPNFGRFRVDVLLTVAARVKRGTRQS